MAIALIPNNFEPTHKVSATKKMGYPSVFKTAGIRSKLISQRFKPPRSESLYRNAGPVPVLFKNAGIGPGAFQTLFRCFYLCRDSLYEKVNITYTGVFESVGIGTTYASAFKSAGIGYIHIFIKTILALLKSTGTGPHDPIPTFKK